MALSACGAQAKLLGTFKAWHVAVTRNAAKYEQECQASNLSWLMGDAPKGPHL